MEEETHTDIERLDPETEFLLSKSQTRNEWELFKENVRPLKRGRKVGILNDALKSHNDNHLKKSLLLDRRRLIQDEYNGDDPLQPWLEPFHPEKEQCSINLKFPFNTIIIEHLITPTYFKNSNLLQLTCRVLTMRDVNFLSWADILNLIEENIRRRDNAVRKTEEDYGG